MVKTIVYAIAILAFIATGIFAQSNAGPCTCDLTQFACDPNCCCDSDCNSADITAFSACSNDYSFSSVQSCFPTSIMFRNYTPYSVNATGGSGISCIYYDKFTARNYFTSPSVESSNVTKVALKAEAFAAFNFSVVTAATDYSVYGSSYTAGNPVHTIYADGNPGRLSQPAAVNSPLCSYSVPALFLSNSASSCSRAVTAASCANDGAIKLASFAEGFRVVQQPAVLNSNSSSLNYTDLLNLTQGALTCRALNGSQIACSGAALPVPLLTGSVCSNVLISLTYRIKYQASSGISEVAYDAVLGTYTVPYTLKQTFTTAYNLSLVATPATYPRSGSPGYVAGKPVLAGTRNTTSDTVSVSTDPTKWLTVPAASGLNGECSSSSSPRSVAFGESLQSGCRRRLDWTSGALSASACADLNAAVRASLAGLGVGNETVVGIFGNASDTVVSDWTPVLVQASPSCADSGFTQLQAACVNILIGGRLDLLVARSGSVTNPQSRILGARLQCTRGNVTFQCSAGACSTSNSTQWFMSSYSVSFIDASATPTSVATSSIFQQRLMKDFFYLIYVENGAAPTAPASVGGWPGCLVIFLLAVCHWLARA